MDVKLVGPSYKLDSRPASVQRTVNMYPVPQEPGNERTPWVLQDVPGLAGDFFDSNIVEARWNPVTTHALVTLSTDLLTASGPLTGAAAGQFSIADIFRSSGKWYFEFLVLASVLSAGHFRPGMGMCRSNFAYLNFGEPRDWCYVYSTNLSGTEYVGATPGSSGNYSGGGPSAVVGSRVMIAVDLGAMRFWVGVNGVWAFSGSPETGANPRGITQPAGSWGPFFWVQGSLGDGTGSVQLITLRNKFAHPIPAGFTPWSEPPPA